MAWNITPLSQAFDGKQTGCLPEILSESQSNEHHQLAVQIGLTKLIMY